MAAFDTFPKHIYQEIFDLVDDGYTHELDMDSDGSLHFPGKTKVVLEPTEFIIEKTISLVFVPALVLKIKLCDGRLAHCMVLHE